MYRNSARFTVALILGALVWVMILLSGCVASMSVPTPIVTPVATPTVLPPTSTSRSSPTFTPVPIATWVAQGVPGDTVIRHYVKKEIFGLDRSITISADGMFTVRNQHFNDITESSGRLSQDELKRIVLKFAEIDFFALSTHEPGCIYYVTPSPRPPTCFPPPDSGIFSTSIMIRGMYKSIRYCAECYPADPRAIEALFQLRQTIEAIVNSNPAVTPTGVRLTPTPSR